MLHLNRKQREVLLDKLPDTANVIMAGTVFGQTIGGQGFSVVLPIVGIGLWAALMIGALLFERSNDR